MPRLSTRHPGSIDSSTSVKRSDSSTPEPKTIESPSTTMRRLASGSRKSRRLRKPSEFETIESATATVAPPAPPRPLSSAPGCEYAPVLRMRLFTPPRELIFRRALRAALQGCESVLDVGCGAESPLATVGFPGHVVAVDIAWQPLLAARRRGTRAALVQADAAGLERTFRPRSVDP